MIDDADEVDALGLAPDTGLPQLVIIDDRDWSDIVGHMNALQAKITNYIGFIKTGQMEKALPEGAGKPPTIKVFQRFEPPETITPLLYGLTQQLALADIGFSYGPLAEGYETA